MRSLIVLTLLCLGGMVLVAGESDGIPSEVLILGVDHRPTAGATISVVSREGALQAVSDAQGKARVRLPQKWQREWVAVIASTDQGKLQAYREFWPADTSRARPLILRLRPARKVEVHVTEANGKPVSGAQVVAGGNRSMPLFSSRTDTKGHVVGWIPEDAGIEQIVALKPGKGIDFQRERGGKAVRRKGGRGKVDDQQEKPVQFVLNGVKPLQITVTDPEGKPIQGVKITPPHFLARGESHYLATTPIKELLSRSTNEKGIAVLDWVPKWPSEKCVFLTSSEKYGTVLIEYDPAKHKGKLSAKLSRRVALRGRVTLPDGKPAEGIEIEAKGIGYVYSFEGKTRTGPDGRYQMLVDPNLAYLVVVNDSRWGAPARTGFAVLPDQPVGDQDFQLQPATRIHGKAFFGGPLMSPGQPIFLTIKGVAADKLSGVKLPNPHGFKQAREPSQYRQAFPDNDGRYEFFVGPGTYQLSHPRTETPYKIEIKDQKEVLVNLAPPRPAKGKRLRGVVVTGTPPQPVSGVVVRGIPRDPRLMLPAQHKDLTSRTNRAGEFELTYQGSSKVVLIARSADGKLAGMIEVASDENKATIPVQPMGSIRGRLIDSAGKPLPRREISCATPIELEGGGSLSTRGLSHTLDTDERGEFKVDQLIVGQRYVIYYHLEGGWTKRELRKVRITDHKPIDVGDVVYWTPSRRLTFEERVSRAFDSKQTPQERFDAAIREARLSKQHVLLVLADPTTEETKEFYRTQFNDNLVSRALNGYRVVAIRRADAEPLARKLQVRLEKQNAPLLLIYDAESARLALSAKAMTRDELLEFITSHQPKILDARLLLAEALAKAKDENKRVLVQETATWCAPCWHLSRFLDRNRAVWEKDYVWVKIDHRWKHADAVMNDLMKGARGGIPWMAILDRDGKVLATSNDPEGENVGFPSNPQSIDHFLSMLRKTKTRLTEEDLSKLRQALKQR